MHIEKRGLYTEIKINWKQLYFTSLREKENVHFATEIGCGGKGREKRKERGKLGARKKEVERES